MCATDRKGDQRVVCWAIRLRDRFNLINRCPEYAGFLRLSLPAPQEKRSTDGRKMGVYEQAGQQKPHTHTHTHTHTNL
jgi:hypothetical protein